MNSNLNQYQNNLAKAREALSYIPSTERDTWLKMGMAIKSEFGDDGYPAWNEFSERATDSYNPRHTKDVWKSIGAGTISIATLFHTAKQYGWEPGNNSKKNPANELQDYKKQMEQVRNQQDTEKRQRQAEAALEARRIWAASIEAIIITSYLSLKGVKAYGVRRYGNVLVIPLRDSNGVLHSLQFIDAKGNKRFLSGGRVKGCYHAIGTAKQLNTGILCVAEGYATGASVYEATGYPVAVAFNAGNMIEAAKALRLKYPHHKIILCADADPVGIKKATEAALAVGGLIAMPSFQEGA